MNTLSPSSELDPIAAELAPLIDAHAGDYPLVSFHEGEAGPAVTWMYAHLVVEVFVEPRTPASVRARVLGGVEVVVRSVREGMELLRRAESLRQYDRDWPYIQLA